MARLGIAFGRARVGDRYVLELMREKGWELGGENSGHIICLDKHTTGDGIVSALQVLSAIRANGTTLSKLCSGLTLYPQQLVNVRVPAGFDWQKKPAIAQAKEDAERSLGADGRVLLRPSGTEPVLRVMVEGKDGTAVKRLAAKIAEAVQQAA
jgi:phosphoglucosamine mutase